MTLNLTGHILLAIGIATSLLAYMFLNDMNQEESYSSGGYSAPSSGYGDRYGRYRSRHFVKKVRMNISPRKSHQHLKLISSIKTKKCCILLQMCILLSFK